MKNEFAKKNVWFFPTLLCIAVSSALLNFLLSFLARLAGVPLYMDCIGTIFAALIGGPLPAVLSAILTGVLNSFINVDSPYFALVGALIAVAISFARREKRFRSVRGLLTLWVTISVIGALFGSLLTWLLYGFDIGGVVSAPVARKFYGDGKMPKLLAQILSESAINFVDKAIALLVALGIFGVLPERFSVRVAKLLHLENGSHSFSDFRHSLLGKVVLVVAVAEVLLGMVASGICYYVYREVSIRKYTDICRGVTGVAATQIDPERVDDYLALGWDAEGYAETEAKLVRILENFPEVAYIYAYRIQEDGCHVVFDPDPEGLKPGEIQEFDESFEAYLPTLFAGGEIAPIITNDTYGWLLTVYQPIFSSSGRCVCYVASDISMANIVTDEASFLAKMLSLFFSASILVMCVMLVMVNERIVHPVNAMATASAQFAYDTDEERSESLARLEELNIRTHDEIENLYTAISQTAEDSTRYIRAIKEQSDKISRLQEAVILDFAEMVEARDQCTGDHIKKTSFYVRGIAEQMKKEGKHTDILTDDYIEKLIRSAPLHDVGKIKISDLILNKPGRLDEEEFEQMKTHTIEGKNILTKTSTHATDEEGYFNEAIEMANSHHERWDGRGYPNGIGGENIPLSARIMAVADVFDALVSRRSYKEPFSFEKAVSIIREESGTHFDPDVVESFLNVCEELYRKGQAQTEKKTD